MTAVASSTFLKRGVASVRSRTTWKGDSTTWALASLRARRRISSLRIVAMLGMERGVRCATAEWAVAGASGGVTMAADGTSQRPEDRIRGSMCRPAASESAPEKTRPSHAPRYVVPNVRAPPHRWSARRKAEVVLGPKSLHWFIDFRTAVILCEVA